MLQRSVNDHAFSTIAPSANDSAAAHKNWLSSIFDTQSDWNLRQAVVMLRSIFCSCVDSGKLTEAYKSIAAAANEQVDASMTIESPPSIPFTRVINAPLYVTSQVVTFDKQFNIDPPVAGAITKPGNFTYVHLPWKGWREIYCYMEWGTNTPYTLVGADVGSGPQLLQQVVLGAGSSYEDISTSRFGPYGIPTYLMPPVCNEALTLADNRQIFGSYTNPVTGQSAITGVPGGAYGSVQTEVAQLYNFAMQYPAGYNFGPYTNTNAWQTGNGYFWNPGSITAKIQRGSQSTATYNSILIAAPSSMQATPGFALDSQFTSGRMINAFFSCDVSTNAAGTNANGKVQIALLSDAIQPSFPSAVLKQQGGKNFISTNLSQTTTKDGLRVGGGNYCLGPNVMEVLRPLSIELVSGLGEGGKLYNFDQIVLNPSGVCNSILAITGADPWGEFAIPGLTGQTYPAGPRYDPGFGSGPGLEVIPPTGYGAQHGSLNVPCCQMLTLVCNSPDNTTWPSDAVGWGGPGPTTPGTQIYDPTPSVPVGGTTMYGNGNPFPSSALIGLWSASGGDNFPVHTTTVPAYGMKGGQTGGRFYGIPLLTGPNPVAFGLVAKTSQLNTAGSFTQDVNSIQTAGPASWNTSYRMTGWNWQGTIGGVVQQGFPSDEDQTAPFAKNMLTDNLGGCFGYMACISAKINNVSGTYAQMKGIDASERLVGNYVSDMMPHMPFNGASFTPNRLIDNITIDPSPEGLPPVFNFTWTFGTASTRAFHLGQGFHLWLRFNAGGMLEQTVQPFSFDRFAGSAPMPVYGTAQPRTQDLQATGFDVVSVVNTNIGNVPAPDHMALTTGQGCDAIGGGIFTQHRERIAIPAYPPGFNNREDRWTYVATYVGFYRQTDAMTLVNISAEYPRYYDTGVIGPAFVTQIAGLTEKQQFSLNLVQVHQVVADAQTAGLGLSNFASAPIIGDKFQQLIQFLFANTAKSTLMTCVKTDESWRKLVYMLYRPGVTFADLLAEIIAQDGATRHQDNAEYISGNFQPSLAEAAKDAGSNLMEYLDEIVTPRLQDHINRAVANQVAQATAHAGSQIGAAGAQLGAAGSQIGAAGGMLGAESEDDCDSADEEEQQRNEEVTGSAGGFIATKDGLIEQTKGTPNRGIAMAPFVEQRRFANSVNKLMGSNLMEKLGVKASMSLSACFNEREGPIAEFYTYKWINGQPSNSSRLRVQFVLIEHALPILASVTGNSAYWNQMLAVLAKSKAQGEAYNHTLPTSDWKPKGFRPARFTAREQQIGRERERTVVVPTSTGFSATDVNLGGFTRYSPWWTYGVVMVVDEQNNVKGFLSNNQWNEIKRIHAGKFRKNSRTTISEILSSATVHYADKAVQVMGTMEEAMTETESEFLKDYETTADARYTQYSRKRRLRGGDDSESYYERISGLSGGRNRELRRAGMFVPTAMPMTQQEAEVRVGPTKLTRGLAAKPTSIQADLRSAKKSAAPAVKRAMKMD